jgi:hypothetical protein
MTEIFPDAGARLHSIGPDLAVIFHRTLVFMKNVDRRSRISIPSFLHRAGRCEGRKSAATRIVQSRVAYGIFPNGSSIAARLLQKDIHPCV